MRQRQPQLSSVARDRKASKVWDAYAWSAPAVPRKWGSELQCLRATLTALRPRVSSEAGRLNCLRQRVSCLRGAVRWRHGSALQVLFTRRCALDWSGKSLWTQQMTTLMRIESLSTKSRVPVAVVRSVAFRPGAGQPLRK